MDAQNGRVVADDFVRQRRIVVQLDAVTGHQAVQYALRVYGTKTCTNPVFQPRPVQRLPRQSQYAAQCQRVSKPENLRRQQFAGSD